MPAARTTVAVVAVDLGANLAGPGTSSVWMFDVSPASENQRETSSHVGLPLSVCARTFAAVNVPKP